MSGLSRRAVVNACIRSGMGAVCLAAGVGFRPDLSKAQTAEPYAANPETISLWMKQWMPPNDKSVTGLLRVARFADPIYVLIAPIEWSPSPSVAKKYNDVKVPDGF